jgi:hypothetical protein
MSRVSPMAPRTERPQPGPADEHTHAAQVPADPAARRPASASGPPGLPALREVLSPPKQDPAVQGRPRSGKPPPSTHSHAASGSGAPGAPAAAPSTHNSHAPAAASGAHPAAGAAGAMGLRGPRGLRGPWGAAGASGSNGPPPPSGRRAFRAPVQAAQTSARCLDADTGAQNRKGSRSRPRIRKRRGNARRLRSIHLRHFFMPTRANLLRNFSTRPPRLSMLFCVPV